MASDVDSKQNAVIKLNLSW